MAEKVRNASLTIGTDPYLVSEAMIAPAMRTALALTNVSTGGQVITLSYGQEAAAGAGIVLYPTGSWSESLDSRFTPSQERLFAISSAAGGTLGVHERIKS